MESVRSAVWEIIWARGRQQYHTYFRGTSHSKIFRLITTTGIVLEPAAGEFEAEARPFRCHVRSL